MFLAGDIGAQICRWVAKSSKKGGFGSRFVRGGDAPHFRHAFSILPTMCRFWLNFVQRVRGVEGEKDRIPVKPKSADNYVGRPNKRLYSALNRLQWWDGNVQCCMIADCDVRGSNPVVDNYCVFIVKAAAMYVTCTALGVCCTSIPKSQFYGRLSYPLLSWNDQSRWKDPRTPRSGEPHVCSGPHVTWSCIVACKHTKNIFLVNVPLKLLPPEAFSAQNALNIVWRPGSGFLTSTVGFPLTTSQP